MLAYRLQQRGLTYAQIAQTLESSPHSVKEWVSKAREGLKVDLRRIDILQEMGETLDFFHDARVTAMGMASDLSISPAVRVEALMAALKTERDKTDFLARAGVYSATSAECMARVIVQSLSSEHSDADKKLHDFMDKLAKDLQEAAQSRLMKAA
ncbi:hypothetical protein [Hydrocarboniphaga effusa]|uniref:hypothetical protein n=1 Tax=Hydrocarboniphaga effusa TaxID=243629 RepID=UPI0031382E2B